MSSPSAFFTKSLRFLFWPRSIRYSSVSEKISLKYKNRERNVLQIVGKKMFTQSMKYYCRYAQTITFGKMGAYYLNNDKKELFG